MGFTAEVCVLTSPFEHRLCLLERNGIEVMDLFVKTLTRARSLFVGTQTKAIGHKKGK